MKKCLIVMNYMSYGGIQKSLINLLGNLEGKVNIDLLLWNRSTEEMDLPDWINVLKIPTIKSIKTAIKENGIFSRTFFLSCLGLFRKKRWTVMPILKKKYDIAIAYTQVGVSKYFVIDKVHAKEKYAFYHHGAYEFNGQIKQFDKEYYPKFDKVFCVSEHIKKILDKELNVNIKYDIFPNYINVSEIANKGNDICNEFKDISCLKILTVARLSKEKNLFKCLEVAKKLKDNNYDFLWLFLGDGDLYQSLSLKITEYNISNNVILMGNQKNPYKYMKNCDLYVQLSEYEAEPITIKEVSVFNKRMILSDIEAFNNAKRYANNIVTCNSIEEIVTEIMNSFYSIRYNDLSEINNIHICKVNELFDICE